MLLGGLFRIDLSCWLLVVIALVVASCWVGLLWCLIMWWNCCGIDDLWFGIASHGGLWYILVGKRVLGFVIVLCLGWLIVVGGLVF